MKRKYLADIGFAYSPDKLTGNRKREKKWKKQRKKYGFDEREVWSMECTFYCWLYERLMMYKKLNDSTPLNDSFTFQGKNYRQAELIEMMLERLRYFFSRDTYEYNEKMDDYIHDIEKIWAVILPEMWW